MVKQLIDFNTKSPAASNDLLLIRDVTSNTEKKTPVSGIAEAIAASFPAKAVKSASLDWSQLSGQQYFGTALGGVSGADAGTSPHSTAQSQISVVLSVRSRVIVESLTSIQQAQSGGSVDNLCRIGTSPTTLYGNESKQNTTAQFQGGMVQCGADVTLDPGTYIFQTYTWTANAALGFITTPNRGYIKALVYPVGA
ncbi:hypothetical protein [Rhodococcus sp. IEGM 1374]|uniref:hypothetical protein n=1 Tax=Rhodococcus sp. IEGM 1374 TaxID=3082221 RepID=UPI0029534B5B|nr:hypothetical protein [Rhodococcus sp. IEGM 1374]MDV7990486.1 hypothetical protein [Rhodococcus sp. IEGM 1374]